MSWSDSDYDGESFARDEREYHERMEALETAREEAKAAEREAERIACAEADEEQEREAIALAEWKAAHPVERLLADLRREAAAPRYAEIANGLFVRTGDGKGRKRRAA